jgi:hypothetical protein
MVGGFCHISIYTVIGARIGSGGLHVEHSVLIRGLTVYYSRLRPGYRDQEFSISMKLGRAGIDNFHETRPTVV